MKTPALKLVGFTSFYILIFVVLTQMTVPYWLLLSLFVVGHFLIIYMVYRVLKEPSSSTKTFKDWYEDWPVKRME